MNAIQYYLTNDLFFSSRVEGVAKRSGANLRVVGSLTKLLEQAEAYGECSSVLIDLTLPSLDIVATVAAMRERFPQARIVAYGPHVQEALLAAAQAAGCDEVLTRGQFDREMQRVVAAK